jgi:hypothetical protein
MNADFKANSAHDVLWLSFCLQRVPVHQRLIVVAHIYDLGLMQFRGPMGLLLSLVRRLRGTIGISAFFERYSRHNPGPVLQGLLVETAMHVAKGHDREDADSVGGWSQREIDALCGRVSFLRGAVPRETEF